MGFRQFLPHFLKKLSCGPPNIHERTLRPLSQVCENEQECLTQRLGRQPEVMMKITHKVGFVGPRQ